jgi:hypothetical protein
VSDARIDPQEMKMEDDVIYFVDGRNADRRERRPMRPGRTARVLEPSSPPAPRVVARPVARPAGRLVARAVVYPTEPTQAQPAFAPAGFAPVAFGPTVRASAATPAYFGGPMHGSLCSPLGNLTLGDLVSLLAQGFAAFRALPPAPEPVNTDVGGPDVDVANLVAFRDAIAREQRTQKQLEFAGRAAAELLGARTSVAGL